MVDTIYNKTAPYSYSQKVSTFYRNALVFLYIWVLLEGILRKWVISGMATPLFFFKYIIIGVATAHFVLNREKISIKDFPFLGVVFFYMFYCVLELANMDVTNTIVVGIIGLAVHFGFVPISLMLPKVIRQKDVFDKLFYIVIYISIPILILGILQYFSPPDSILNKYVSEDQVMATLGEGGEYARITSIFSYLAGPGTYLAFVLPFIFMKLTTDFKPDFKGIVTVGVLVLGIINLLMTGSRGPVAYFALSVTCISIAMMTEFGGIKSNASSFLLKLLLIGSIAVIGLLFTKEGSTALEVFIGRVENNNDISGRIEDNLSPLKFYDQAGLIGFGIGTTYQGSQPFLTGRSKMPSYWEEESERIVLELGLIGFILCVITRLSIFYFGLKTLFTVSDNNLKKIALVIIVHQLPVLIFINLLVFNWLEHIIYWTEAGLLVAIYQIDQHEKQKSKNLSLASR